MFLKHTKKSIYLIGRRIKKGIRVVTTHARLSVAASIISLMMHTSHAAAPTTPQQISCTPITNASSTTPIPSAYIATPIPTPASYAERIATTDTDGPSSAPSGLSLKQVKNLLSNPHTAADQKVALISQHNTAADGSSMKIKPSTKNRPTATGRALSQGPLASFTQSKRTATPASVTFADGATQQAYQAFVGSLQANPGFIPLFRKLHIVALHEIYLYLVGIYTALTMTHIDDVKTYMATEKTYALNKKTLIVTHLVNLIQAQLNSALQALFPGLPETYTIKSGMGALEQDSGSNLDTLVVNLEQSVMAVMGISTLSLQQITATINELTAHLPNGSATPTFTDATLTQALANANYTQGATVADLQAAIGVMNTQGTTFISSLTDNQTYALVGAFSILLAFYSNTQTATNLKSIIAALSTPGATLTSQQMDNFQTLVSQCAVGQQLAGEIAISQQIGQALQTNSSTPFTANQVTALQGIVGYLLQNYEEQALDGIKQIVQALGKLNPQAQVISVLDALTLKPLAAALLGLNGTKIMPLASLTDAQRFSLAYALGVLSNQATNNTTQQTLLQLSQSLNNAPLENAELTSAQTTALNNALTQLANYVFNPLQAQNVGSSLTQAQQTAATSAAAKMNAQSFTSFDSLTTDEQLASLTLFQEISRVMETRLTVHRQQSSLVASLFAGNTQLQNALFTSISSDQYQALSFFDKMLQQNTPFSPATLAAQQVTTPDGVTLTLSVADALIPLFQEKTTNATPSYYSILIQLDQQYFSDPALQAVIKTIPASAVMLYQNAIAQFNNPNFSLASLDEPTKKSLLTVFTDYLQQKTVPTAQAPTTAIAFENANQEAVNVVANTLFYTHVFTQGRTTFLATLQLYLQFFTLYTQTLQTPATPTYTALSTFESLAKTISQQLEDTPIQSINPPLFFFNDATFRSIRLLPKLAQLVDGTQRAPYPTFSIELAVQGSAVDPTSGTTYQNQQTTGPVTYNKFFFLDPSQSNPTLKTQIEQGIIPAPELTGQLPAWITKTPVPTSNKNSYQYVYTPNTELTGITGFYMNIPTFEPDPNNSKSSLIRLYEQPIIAQPLWLSNSGWPTSTTTTNNNPSIVTMLRGCLGDFQSLLSIPGVFDPCLTIIFTKALATSTNAQADQALTDACSNYISEKLADQQRQTSIQNSSPNTLNQQPNTQGAAS